MARYQQIVLPLTGITLGVWEDIVKECTPSSLESWAGEIDKAINEVADLEAKRLGGGFDETVRESVLNRLRGLSWNLSGLEEPKEASYTPATKTIYINWNRLGLMRLTQVLLHELEHELQHSMGTLTYEGDLPWQDRTVEIGASVREVRERLRFESADEILSRTRDDLQEWMAWIIEMAKDVEPQSVVGRRNVLAYGDDYYVLSGVRVNFSESLARAVDDYLRMKNGRTDINGARAVYALTSFLDRVLSDSIIPSLAQRLAVDRQEVVQMLSRFNWRVGVLGVGVNGAWEKSSNTLYINVNSLLPACLQGNIERMSDTILHEIEHYFQDFLEVPLEHLLLSTKSDQSSEDAIRQWLETPGETSADVSKVRELLNRGVSEEEILSPKYFDTKWRDYGEFILQLAKDVEPQSVVGGLDKSALQDPSVPYVSIDIRDNVRKIIQFEVPKQLAKRVGISEDEARGIVREVSWNQMSQPGAQFSKPNLIHIGPEVPDLEDSMILSVLLHELEHYFQFKTGEEFPRTFDPWSDKGTEQSAMIQEFRYKLDQGLTPEQIKEEMEDTMTFHNRPMETIEWAIELAQDMEPQTVLSSKKAGKWVKSWMRSTASRGYKFGPGEMYTLYHGTHSGHMAEIARGDLSDLYLTDNIHVAKHYAELQTDNYNEDFSGHHEHSTPVIVEITFTYDDLNGNGENSFGRRKGAFPDTNMFIEPWPNAEFDDPDFIELSRQDIPPRSWEDSLDFSGTISFSGHIDPSRITVQSLNLKEPSNDQFVEASVENFSGIYNPETREILTNVVSERLAKRIGITKDEALNLMRQVKWTDDLDNAGGGSYVPSENTIHLFGDLWDKGEEDGIATILHEFEHFLQRKKVGVFPPLPPDTLESMEFRLTPWEDRYTEQAALIEEMRGLLESGASEEEILSRDVRPRSMVEWAIGIAKDLEPQTVISMKKDAILVVCAWCKKSMGEKPPLEDKRTSHGICPECAKKWEKQAARTYTLYHGTWGWNIGLVEEEGLRPGNSGRTWFGISPEQVETHLLNQWQDAVGAEHGIDSIHPQLQSTRKEDFPGIAIFEVRLDFDDPKLKKSSGGYWTYGGDIPVGQVRLVKTISEVPSEQKVTAKTLDRTPYTLWHGTVIDNAESIQEQGLLPQFGGYQQQYWGSRGTPTVFGADDEHFGDAVLAMQFWVGQKLGKTREDVTWDDIIRYGLIVEAHYNNLLHYGYDEAGELDEFGDPIDAVISDPSNGDIVDVDKPAGVEHNNLFSFYPAEPVEFHTGLDLALLIYKMQNDQGYDMIPGSLYDSEAYMDLTVSEEEEMAVQSAKKIDWDEIRAAAEAIRAQVAGSCGIDNPKRRPGNPGDVPEMECRPSNEALWRVLQDMGYTDANLVVGHWGSDDSWDTGEPSYTHVWVEFDDMLIDLAADQFNKHRGEFIDEFQPDFPPIFIHSLHDIGEYKYTHQYTLAGSWADAETEKAFEKEPYAWQETASLKPKAEREGPLQIPSLGEIQDERVKRIILNDVAESLAQRLEVSKSEALDIMSKTYWEGSMPFGGGNGAYSPGRNVLYLNMETVPFLRDGDIKSMILHELEHFIHAQFTEFDSTSEIVFRPWADRWSEQSALVSEFAYRLQQGETPEQILKQQNEVYSGTRVSRPMEMVEWALELAQDVAPETIVASLDKRADVASKAPILLKQYASFFSSIPLYVRGVQVHPASEDYLEAVVNYLVLLAEDADPTEDYGTYLPWLMKQVAGGNLPDSARSTTKSDLSIYDRVKKLKNFPQQYRDINRLSDPSELNEIVGDYQDLISEREREKIAQETGAKTVFDADGWKVVEITTPEAAAMLCRDTHWCIKDPTYSTKYLRGGNRPLYLVYRNGQKEFMMHETAPICDRNDDPIDRETFELLRDSPIYGYHDVQRIIDTAEEHVEEEEEPEPTPYEDWSNGNIELDMDNWPEIMSDATTNERKEVVAWLYEELKGGANLAWSMNSIIEDNLIPQALESAGIDADSFYDLLGKRVLECGDPAIVHRYAQSVIGGRWPEGEFLIAENPAVAERYMQEFKISEDIFKPTLFSTPYAINPKEPQENMLWQPEFDSAEPDFPQGFASQPTNEAAFYTAFNRYKQSLDAGNMSPETFQTVTQQLEETYGMQHPLYSFPRTVEDTAPVVRVPGVDAEIRDEVIEASLDCALCQGPLIDMEEKICRGCLDISVDGEIEDDVMEEALQR